MLCGGCVILAFFKLMTTAMKLKITTQTWLNTLVINMMSSLMGQVLLSAAGEHCKALKKTLIHPLIIKKIR